MFRGATRKDLPQILKIYAHAREVMRASGNPTQWGDHFPPEEQLAEDIDANRLFLYLVNGQLEGVFAFILGSDPTYQTITDGHPAVEAGKLVEVLQSPVFQDDVIAVLTQIHGELGSEQFAHFVYTPNSRTVRQGSFSARSSAAVSSAVGSPTSST